MAKTYAFEEKIMAADRSFPIPTFLNSGRTGIEVLSNDSKAAGIDKHASRGRLCPQIERAHPVRSRNGGG